MAIQIFHPGEPDVTLDHLSYYSNIMAHGHNRDVVDY